MIDTSSKPNSKQKVLILSEEEEKSVKQHLKLKEESESLLKVLRLFN